jgi:hypothetical protein
MAGCYSRTGHRSRISPMHSACYAAGMLSSHKPALTSTGTYFLRELSSSLGTLLATAAIWSLLSAQPARAQSAGALDFTARITPSAARPEPVRQFTFYLLTKSYKDIWKEVEAKDVIPSRDQFIAELKLSPELKAWLKAHDVFDLTMPGLDKLLTADDILHVPEFLQAYQRSNSGGVTDGIPKPKYKDADKTENPDRYEKQHQEYLAALKKFIQSRPETISGIELELEAVSPQRKWTQIQADHTKRIQRLAPDLAQTQYLAGKTETDLDGHGTMASLPAGHYWVSSLGWDANAGDERLRWDVPVTVQTGQTTRVELTNLNATEMHGLTP